MSSRLSIICVFAFFPAMSPFAAGETPATTALQHSAPADRAIELPTRGTRSFVTWVPSETPALIVIDDSQALAVTLLGSASQLLINLRDTVGSQIPSRHVYGANTQHTRRIASLIDIAGTPAPDSELFMSVHEEAARMLIAIGRFPSDQSSPQSHDDGVIVFYDSSGTSTTRRLAIRKTSTTGNEPTPQDIMEWIVTLSLESPQALSTVHVSDRAVVAASDDGGIALRLLGKMAAFQSRLATSEHLADFAYFDAARIKCLWHHFDRTVGLMQQSSLASHVSNYRPEYRRSPFQDPLLWLFKECEGDIQ